MLMSNRPVGEDFRFSKYILHNSGMCRHTIMCVALPVCQARALLLAALWLQKHLDNRSLRAAFSATWPTNVMLVIGGAGAGKTHVLLLVDCLFQHFLGPQCLLKAAPTITAARLLGGNTIHALHHLPRTGGLRGRQGRLRAVTITKHRKEWSHVVGHAADEIGMLSPKLLYQINVRTQSAKKNNATFGGLWSWLSGDFLQLPPIGQPSLAQPLADATSVRAPDGLDADDPEHSVMASI